MKFIAILLLTFMIAALLSCSLGETLTKSKSALDPYQGKKTYSISLENCPIIRGGSDNRDKAIRNGNGLIDISYEGVSDQIKNYMNKNLYHYNRYQDKADYIIVPLLSNYHEQKVTAGKRSIYAYTWKISFNCSLTIVCNKVQKPIQKIDCGNFEVQMITIADKFPKIQLPYDKILLAIN